MKYNTIKRLFDIPFFQLQNNPLSNAFNNKQNGQWIGESSQSFIDKFTLVSKALLELGIQRNDKIAIISEVNCTEWHIIDMAIQQVGAISVPIYPNLSEAETSYIFNHASVQFCFVSSQDLLEKMLQIKSELPQLKSVYTFNAGDTGNEFSLSSLLLSGQKSDKDALLTEIKNTIQYEDLVTIIYTSGTTGKPKGVMLSHKNIISNIIYTIDCVPPQLGVALSFLPICHAFERMATYLYQLESIQIYFAESVEKLAENAQEVHPHIMTVVPRLLEKVYDKIMAKAHDLKGIKKNIFFWALELVENYEPFQKNSFLFNIQLSMARKLIFNKWKAALGGEIQVLICGSAALQKRLIRIFDAAGLPILEGYGMTEASPIVSGAKWVKEGYQVGTTGKVLKNITAKIAEDGEILIKGDNVMMGYYREPEMTAEVFTEDGFFKTGDVGNLNERGLLSITDRKREMFKTSGGKYIAPQAIENKMKGSKFIEEALVVGANEKMPCAFIQPDFQFLKSWIKEKGFADIDLSSNKAIIASKEVSERIQKEVEQVNQGLGKWEQIKKFTVVLETWSIEMGVLTPTLKLKRNILMKLYEREYNVMYNK
jgi:long-chain acyl-CoA synthetase